MFPKILGWVLLVLNIIMVIYSLVTPMESQLWVIAVFVLETYINIKYLESLK